MRLLEHLGFYRFDSLTNPGLNAHGLLLATRLAKLFAATFALQLNLGLDGLSVHLNLAEDNGITVWHDLILVRKFLKWTVLRRQVLR